MAKWMMTAAAAAMMTMVAGGASAQSFGINLIRNGDAEAGQKGGGEVVPVPGFTTTGEFTVTSYGAGGGFPSRADAGGGNVGDGFFAGGFDSPSTGLQVIDLSAIGAALDLGASYTLSALLGGFSGQGDNAVLGLTFRGAGAGVLGTATLGPVTPGDRGDVTGLLPRSTGGVVPVGTRAVEVLLTLTRTNGSANDGYADNLSLVLTSNAAPGPVPEPAGWAMLIGGVGLIGGALRRQRRGWRAARPA